MNQKAKTEYLPKGVKKDVPLASFTTFKIGGPAKYFLEVESKEQLIKTLLIAQELKEPFFILGGGSNLVVSDKGFDGLLIKMQNKKYETVDQNIIAEAGVLLDDLVKSSLENSLMGLEWAAGIPGTLGGAIRGNAAAFGNSMDNLISQVEVFDSKTQRIERLKKVGCQFDYKNSIFKQNPHLIILSAELQLKRGSKKEIEKKINEYLKYRETNHPLDFPSAGCIFQNQKSKIRDQKLLDEFPMLEQSNKKGEIPAGFLIDKCGLKGRRIGQAQISEKHANFIVNAGGAKGEDVLQLISLIKKKVKDKFGIELEEEIQYLGF